MTNVKLSSCIALGTAALFAVACSTTGDSTFSPTGPAFESTRSPQIATVCKTGPAGTYSFTAVLGGNANTNDALTSGSPFDLIVPTDGATACTTVFTRTVSDDDVCGSNGELCDTPRSILVTESAHDGTTLTNITAGPGADVAVIDKPNSRVTLYVNAFHGATATFYNEAVSTGCTYTKGWYRNNGSNTIIAGIDGLTKTQQQQIFAATPGKPGGWTWGADNNNLNLYQQLLAALNNLGGNATGGPDAVDDAIADALAATSVSGTTITVAAGTDVSGLISVLSAFNEGSLTGWAHCAD